MSCFFVHLCFLSFVSSPFFSLPCYVFTAPHVLVGYLFSANLLKRIVGGFISYVCTYIYIYTFHCSCHPTSSKYMLLCLCGDGRWGCVKPCLCFIVTHMIPI
ncbi:hypothetical protein QBC46DRAFT_30513 [Diplogelasinospora grovesii]|uniref:Secreted protein n=1 Tax=Diplogelasinospora grovesii TaxID=303347 RepID=A0AAN6MZL7_9PEZI|nr:hypothetical protein QBC46DRAFT_30513 [Diplogelasinospora grovesii]